MFMEFFISPKRQKSHSYTQRTLVCHCNNEKIMTYLNLTLAKKKMGTGWFLLKLLKSDKMKDTFSTLKSNIKRSSKRSETQPDNWLWLYRDSKLSTSQKPCADGVEVIAISLFLEVPGSIPEHSKKSSFLWKPLFVHAVHLLRFLRRSDPFRGITSP